MQPPRSELVGRGTYLPGAECRRCAPCPSHRVLRVNPLPNAYDRSALAHPACFPPNEYREQDGSGYTLPCERHRMESSAATSQSRRRCVSSQPRRRRMNSHSRGWRASCSRTHSIVYVHQVHHVNPTGVGAYLIVLLSYCFARSSIKVRTVPALIISRGNKRCPRLKEQRFW